MYRNEEQRSLSVTSFLYVLISCYLIYSFISFKVRVPCELTSPKRKCRTQPQYLLPRPKALAAVTLEWDVKFVICLDVSFKSGWCESMLVLLKFFVYLKWTVSEEGRRGGGITWKLSGLLKWVSYILYLSSGDQIFIFLLGLMECFYLYILLVLDVLCKGKPELQTFFFSLLY